MNRKKSVADAPLPAVVDTRGSDTRLMRSLLIGIFIFMVIYALYFARDFFMPVVLAFLLALTLTPIVRFLKWHGVPEPLSATLLVLLAVLSLTAVGYFLSGPIVDLVNRAPTIGRQVTERLAELRHPFEQVMEVSKQVEKVAETAQEPGMQKVVVAQPGILSQAAGNLLSAGTTGHHLRAVAVPARLGHDVLRKDRPVLRANEREEARPARRLRCRARNFALPAHRRAHQHRPRRGRGGSGSGAWACRHPIVWGLPPRRCSISCPISAQLITMVLVGGHRAHQLRHALLRAIGAGLRVRLRRGRGPVRDAAGRRSAAGDQRRGGVRRGGLLVLAMGLHRRTDRGAAARRHQGVLRQFRRAGATSAISSAAQSAAERKPRSD